MTATLMLAGCTTVRYVPVETSHNDSVYVAYARVDSIAVTDSIDTYRMADTVRITRWRTETRWHTERDTVWRNRTDTVRITIPVHVSQHKSLMEKLGSAASGICAGVIMALLTLLWIKQRRQ